MSTYTHTHTSCAPPTPPLPLSLHISIPLGHLLTVGSAVGANGITVTETTRLTALTEWERKFDGVFSFFFFFTAVQARQNNFRVLVSDQTNLSYCTAQYQLRLLKRRKKKFQGKKITDADWGKRVREREVGKPPKNNKVTSFCCRVRL
jgi:hypothetical protein